MVLTTGNDVLDGLALKGETKEREKADENGRGGQNVDHKVKDCVHLLYLTFLDPYLTVCCLSTTSVADAKAVTLLAGRGARRAAYSATKKS